VGSESWMSAGGQFRRRFGGRWRDRTTVVAVAGTAATITVLAVGGIALATGDDSVHGWSTTADVPIGEPGERPHLRHLVRPGFLAAHGALHGEFVVRDGDDDFQTIAMQRGKATSVSESSITVESEDGYSRSYAITAETLVNSNRDGIDSVEEGELVSVVAVVEGDSATAIRLTDASAHRELREKFRHLPFRFHDDELEGDTRDDN